MTSLDIFISLVKYFILRIPNTLLSTLRPLYNQSQSVVNDVIGLITGNSQRSASSIVPVIISIIFVYFSFNSAIRSVRWAYRTFVWTAKWLSILGIVFAAVQFIGNLTSSHTQPTMTGAVGSAMNGQWKEAAQQAYGAAMQKSSPSSPGSGLEPQKLNNDWNIDNQVFDQDMQARLSYAGSVVNYLFTKGLTSMQRAIQDAKQDMQSGAYMSKSRSQRQKDTNDPAQFVKNAFEKMFA